MKLKIIEIEEKKDVFKPEGKNYSIYTWIIKAEINGTTKTVPLKAFSPITASVGDVLEVEEDKYKDYISYKIVKQKSVYQKSGWSNPHYTMSEFDALYRHAYDVCRSTIPHDLELSVQADILQRATATYLIRATNAGVKVETDSTGGKPGDNPEERVRKVKAIYDFTGQEPKSKWVDDEIKKSINHKRADEIIGVIQGWELKKVEEIIF